MCPACLCLPICTEGILATLLQVIDIAADVHILHLLHLINLQRLLQPRCKQLQRLLVALHRLRPELARMTVIHIQRNDPFHVHKKTASFRLHISRGTCIIPVEGNKQKNADTYEEPVYRVSAYFSAIFITNCVLPFSRNPLIFPAYAVLCPGRACRQSWR